MLAAEYPERSLEQRAIVRLIEPARRAAGMRQRDQDPLAVALHRPDHVTERNLADKSLDRELTHEENDPRADKGDLSVEPRRAVRDLGRARLAIASPARGLAGKALRDRCAIRKMLFIDPCAREPASQLRARATGERQTRRELDRAGRLADDHHAIGRMARDDRERARNEPRIRASRARADLRMKNPQFAFGCHGINGATRYRVRPCR